MVVACSLNGKILENCDFFDAITDFGASCTYNGANDDHTDW